MREGSFHQLRRGMPAAQARADGTLEPGESGGCSPGRGPARASPRRHLPAEEVLRALDAEAGQRPLDVVQRPFLLAAVADVRQPGLDLLGQGERAWRGGPPAGAPWPSGRSPPASDRSTGAADAAPGRCRGAPAAARRRRRRTGRAHAPPAGSRASPPGCRRRWPARPGPGRPPPARGSCTAASRSPSRGGSRTTHRPACPREARSAGSTAGRSASDLAIPQSTTSVSPNRPSMMFSGFRSRCTTPRLCA